MFSAFGFFLNSLTVIELHKKVEVEIDEQEGKGYHHEDSILD